MPLGIVNITDDMTYQLYDFQAYKEGFVFNEARTQKSTFAVDTFRLSYAYFNLAPTQSAGTVTLQTHSLNSFEATYSNVDNEDAKPDGSQKVWSVSGSSVVPSFTDSVLCSNSQVIMSTPANAADVSRSSNLSITWSVGDTNDIAAVEIISKEDSTGAAFFDTYSNTGSCTVSSSTLSGFANGQASIVLRRGRYKIGTASNGKKYILLTWTQHERDINFTN